jgi:hypothetical protein
MKQYYNIENNMFVLCAVLMGENSNQKDDTFMQAFLYRSGNRPGEQAGFDEPVLINATTFNLTSFSLADFGVYIERAYVLEHTKGIYHF